MASFYWMEKPLFGNIFGVVMPLTIGETPSVLPSPAKEIFVAAFNNSFRNTCEGDTKEKDECASKIAWSAVKGKFKLDADGNWIPKAELTEFSLRITKSHYHTASNEMRWKADASDIDEDSRQDSMSLGLFSDFLERIQNNERPPEKYVEEIWEGGMPYLSLSHYRSLGGKGVPGTVDKTYVDGKFFKANGTYHDTPLGRACFKSINTDLNTELSETDKKVRISIAFLDWMHRHKSDGSVFERESENDICLQCILESIIGTGEGNEFLKGHLVHLALTREPVNKRTSMEVDKSMTTRKEDAASIATDELAEKLEELTEEEKAEVSKAALVIKAKASEKEDEEEDEDGKEKKRKKDKEEKSDVVERIKALINEPAPEHALDASFDALKSVFDETLASEATLEEKFVALQAPYGELVETVKSLISDAPVKEKSDTDKFADALLAINQTLALQTETLNSQNQQLEMILSNPAQITTPTVPVQRSIVTSAPADLIPGQRVSSGVAKSSTPKLRAIIEGNTLGH